MSYLVLHMDKFKKEAVRGIQSHNNRERESRSNPDIDYERSAGNYDLHESAVENYGEAIQNRIDDLLLVKAVRKDAVHMCGLIVSSDSAFFEKLSPEDTRRFFEESKAFLTEFVGAENVISAMVHLDEKTPHMHFLHVPVTQDGRLNANTIYTRESLKNLQTELPRHLQSRGFDLQRGVEQEPGAKKKHLNTREFKQQQEALNSLEKEAEAKSAELEQRQLEESALQERLQSIERQAQEAEKALSEQTDIPKASMLNFKSVLETAQEIIERQKKALAAKGIVDAHNEKLRADNGRLQTQVRELSDKVLGIELQHAEERQKIITEMRSLSSTNQNLLASVERAEKFFRWNTAAAMMRDDYERGQREEARQREAERKRQAEEQARRQEEERARQAQEQERQKAREAERRREEREAEKARYLERRSRGMGMGR
ncbi:putative recombination protein [uncultured delta proteobacterium]|uniref:Putative recombination protein n=1 Tax=uncultured delta proteobacterium TaxID=34034 RepID=A0A212K9I4_9DELT|nr:putative recombination protein [uncultured delta proteobacterium]